jgi:GH24 family phage-related lysozyme (muramidase)
MIKMLFLLTTLPQFIPTSCYSTYYEEAVKIIKHHEGFRSCEYTLEGVRTIGYGHTIKKGESFKCLTETQADSLLRVDFNSALKRVDTHVGVKGSRKISLGHFIYCKGIGTFLKSSIYSKLKDGIELIEEDFTKYRFRKSRVFEWELWKLNCN